MDLLALGASLTRLVPLRRMGAPAGAAEGPVAAALTTAGAGIHQPDACADALERAAASLEESARPRSPGEDAAGHLRDAARILRRERALFE